MKGIAAVLFLSIGTQIDCTVLCEVDHFSCSRFDSTVLHCLANIEDTSGPVLCSVV